MNGKAAGPQSLVIVNESGFYVVVFTSRKETAKRFRRWMIAPEIRATGSYQLPGAQLTGAQLAAVLQDPTILRTPCSPPPSS